MSNENKSGEQCKHIHVCYFSGFSPQGKPAETLVGGHPPTPRKRPLGLPHKTMFCGDPGGAAARPADAE